MACAEQPWCKPSKLLFRRFPAAITLFLMHCKLLMMRSSPNTTDRHHGIHIWKLFASWAVRNSCSSPVPNSTWVTPPWRNFVCQNAFCYLLGTSKTKLRRVAAPNSTRPSILSNHHGMKDRTVDCQIGWTLEWAAAWLVLFVNLSRNLDPTHFGSSQHRRMKIHQIFTSSFSSWALNTSFCVYISSFASKLPSFNDVLKSEVLGHMHFSQR